MRRRGTCPTGRTTARGAARSPHRPSEPTFRLPVLRRLAGETANTAPVMTLITQFGGGMGRSRDAARQREGRFAGQGMDGCRAGDLGGRGSRAIRSPRSACMAAPGLQGRPYCCPMQPTGIASTVAPARSVSEAAGDDPQLMTTTSESVDMLLTCFRVQPPVHNAFSVHACRVLHRRGIVVNRRSRAGCLIPHGFRQW